MSVLNRYRLGHVTQFSYDGPVSESYNELRLRPRHDEGQSCLTFRLTTNPVSRPNAHLDFYGNWVHQFHILPEHRELRVESEAVVLVHPPAPPACSALTMNDFDALRDSLADDYYDWLSSSVYCPLVEEIEELAADVERQADGKLYDFAQVASSIIHARFKYQQGATHVNSSILDCLARQAGVCQDFSHLLLAILRSRGVPGRYVSGYLVPRQTEDEQAMVERVIGGQASHAWVEALIPGMGWIGLDPTVGNLWIISISASLMAATTGMSRRFAAFIKDTRGNIFPWTFWSARLWMTMERNCCRKLRPHRRLVLTGSIRHRNNNNNNETLSSLLRRRCLTSPAGGFVIDQRESHHCRCEGFNRRSGGCCEG